MNLLRSFSIYTLATILNRGIAFVLTPVLTFFLSEEDMGTLSLFSLYLLFTTVLIGVGGKGAISVKYFQLERGAFQQYFTSALVGPLIVFASLLGLGLVFHQPLARLTGLPDAWVMILSVTGLCQVFNELCLTYFRVKGAAARFAYFSIGLTIVNLSLSLALVIALRMGWEGRALGIVFSYGLFFLISIWIMAANGLFTRQINRKYVRAALAFGIPLIPHLLGTFTIEYSDKVFIQKMEGTEELGVYDVGYKFGMSVQFFVTAFFLSFGPYLFESLENLTEYKRIKLVRLSYLFLTALALAVLALSLVAPLLFRWIIDEKFYEGHIYVFWVAAGYFFFGCYSLVANYVHFSGKTYYFSILAVINVAVNLGLNYLLIRKYGTIGAAYATLISYVLIFVLTALIAHRLYPMPWFRREVFDWEDIRRWGRDAWKQRNES